MNLDDPPPKAKTMAEALFVPWRSDGCKIIDDTGDVVCTTILDTEAAFIVRCANAHDALIAALQSMSDIARVKYGNLDPNANKVFEQAETALKLAKAT